MQRLYFKPRMSRSKRKSSGDTADPTVLFKVLCCEIKIFFIFFFIYYLCEKSYKPITVQ